MTSSDEWKQGKGENGKGCKNVTGEEWRRETSKVKESKYKGGGKQNEIKVGWSRMHDIVRGTEAKEKMEKSVKR